jgi:hypothetical protein
LSGSIADRCWPVDLINCLAAYSLSPEFTCQIFRPCAFSSSFLCRYPMLFPDSYFTRSISDQSNHSARLVSLLTGLTTGRPICQIVLCSLHFTYGGEADDAGIHCDSLGPELAGDIWHGRFWNPALSSFLRICESQMCGNDLWGIDVALTSAERRESMMILSF